MAETSTAVVGKDDDEDDAVDATTPTESVKGVIVRRSCLGKKLSFADLRTENGAIVKVAFRRSTGWQEDVSARPFPVKTSELPYGALVSMTLQKTSGNVIAWELLQDPKQTAEDKATSTGINYSTYLRERGNLFTNTTKGQYIHSGVEPPKKKRSRPTTTVTSTENDDLSSQPGGHGDKQAKVMRTRLFAQWLLDVFGKDLLAQGSGVLDVAGGKGQLSIELACQHIPCTVIDPLIRKKQSTTISSDSNNGFPVKRDAKRVRKAGGPMPRHLPAFFNQEEFVQQYGKRKKNQQIQPKSSSTTTNSQEVSTEPSHDINPQQLNDDDDDDDNYLIENCSCLVGLHPDQTTQDIVEMALRFQKPVAMVPCCVFPSFFPIRTLHNGTNVNTHEQFCEFLTQQDPSLQCATLPFQGRNVVLYRTS
ncbi:expressed unknown protein [Seminavis robusta]|uniref:Methyltransferase domain-containing protein n=1 Tax=Seminavis robusta TaxID=568900 RepID=A0A9N8H2M9_9STRA|nr:expressed unknown protein [Seminavis robusta]|eukprot:Sro40_g024500.1 n/a (420) ;mRNA; f:15606-16865